jgi:uncharacterized protein (DUF302 family)
MVFRRRRLRAELTVPIPSAVEVKMKYYIAKTVSGNFPAVVDRAIEALKAEGFGVLTDIDVKATMKKKLDLDFRDYRILGACNPPLAHQALTADDKIGTMLPCNVIVQDLGGGQIEVAAIDPAISMEQVGNPTIKSIAKSVTDKLQRVIAAI